MTEQEWLSCTDPYKLIDFLEQKVDGLEKQAKNFGDFEEGKRLNRQIESEYRSMFFFRLACCRHLGPLLVDDRSWQALEDDELYWDGLIPAQEMEKHERAANEAASELGEETPEGQAARAVLRAIDPFDGGFQDARAVLEHAQAAVAWPSEFDLLATQADYFANLLREFVSNPFRCITANQSWITADGRALAQAAYDERALPSGLFDNGRLAVLADALEEAGCDQAEILDHCRKPREHFRGCWVVDLILGKLRRNDS